MKFKWYGHASFGITTADGVHICTDPYIAGSYDGAIGYGPIRDACDVVLQSHGHDDHAGAGELGGNPVVVRGAGTHKVRGITFVGTHTYHDERQGRERGENTVFTFEADGMKVAFLGDLGHVLSDEQVAAVGPVDVVLIPVGGHYTIDAATATKVAEQLEAKVIFPMHYKTDACGFPLATVDDFVAGKANVERPGASEVEITVEDLGAPKVVVLDYVK
ncbi:MAG: MBL fold metallo-hydrolase [candidate division Zixibacteria bacterium]|nr:MBL fold metallo-hydrolase [candidate division Zixibacteria bacterium]